MPFHAELHRRLEGSLSFVIRTAVSAYAAMPCCLAAMTNVTTLEPNTFKGNEFESAATRYFIFHLTKILTYADTILYLSLHRLCS